MTAPYQRILVAIDCSDESADILCRAAGVLEGNATGELHLIHVIEPLALAYGADVPMDVTDLQSGLVKQARETALEYARQYQIGEDRIHVELGSIEKTIVDKADALGVDLIVVGSHTRSGLALLLGSTARGLVPGAHCDVLAVKVQRKDKKAD
ncbi:MULTISPECIES: universal stress protein [Alloalcanivorax]|uniref:Universal stress protein n=1 Tax=Alloalcanivorax balearicus MACL04 TaxID=1177182 RepID=A0ABT2R1M1_9GAMM|nr:MULTISPECIES: universal stress protein [Alloalcanivorax]ERS14564.1 universal stress protein A [Alcanivorax sp. PN-3]KYZ88246.1 universal stress protein UspA [Alcanivorax sp. KX64203]MBA4722711.1 universal stress protein [Alcanivorax sp.]ARB45480.1 universal stress protein UspA [Alloalcanivorax xenomutans]MCE7523611.1 universal stress protein [Alloalcanivorax xenomutans]